MHKIFHHRFFSTKYPLLTPQITTFPGVDFGKHFLLFERAFRKLLNSNEIALYKAENIIYLRFSILQRFFFYLNINFNPKITTFK